MTVKIIDMKKICNLIFIAFIICFICSCNLGKDPNNGVIEEFYPNGSIKSETPLKNGLRNGLVKNYSEAGHLLSTAEYVNDLRNGWVINYSTENGKPMFKAMYKDDVQHGQLFQYYQEGMLFRESNYVNGRVDGLVKTYWPNGNVKAENFFKMGKPSIGLKEFDKDGNSITNQPYIIVEEVNQIDVMGRVLIRIYLSEKADETEFYLDDDFDGKYLSNDAYKLRIIDDVASAEYPVPKGTTYKKNLIIVAKFRTKLGNTMLMKKNYMLSLSNNN
jgi:hypothetical protein